LYFLLILSRKPCLWGHFLPFSGVIQKSTSHLRSLASGLLASDRK
jgi:hypothetical protein